MKIIFLNVWHGKIKKKLLDFVEFHKDSTDIFCFQECYPEITNELKNLLSNYQEFSDYKHVDESDNFPQVSFIKNDIEVIDTKFLLKDDLKIGFCLFNKINYKNKIIHLANVHGFAKPGDKKDNPHRLRQSKLLLDHFSKLEGVKIIGGDFNLEKETKSIKMFEEEGYKNLIEYYKIKTTRNRLIWEKYPKTKQFYSDYVFVNDLITVTNFEVPDNEISDHLPMIVEFKI